MKKLTARETIFCRLYASCRNGREAAFRAGYTVCPEINSKKLLSQERIVKEIGRIEKETQLFEQEVKAGLRRLAFSSSADAVKLLLAEDTENIQVESLDLFNVSEIKRPKNGGIEIKFFDRIKALEKLGELSEVTRADKSVPFYEALEKSASSLDGEAKA